MSTTERHKSGLTAETCRMDGRREVADRMKGGAVSDTDVMKEGGM